MKVRDLLPGMVIEGPTSARRSATVITVVDRHPLHLGFSLVIWRFPDGGTSFDALLPSQEIVEPLPWTSDLLRDNLRRALGVGVR